MIDLHKLLEIWMSRKNKFNKAEERATRRENFYNEIKLIEAEEKNGLDKSIVRAKKNSAAQKVTGSGLITYDFLDYYLRNPNFINFEIISPMVVFWEGVIKKTYQDDKLVKIEINNFLYYKELGVSVSTFLFSLLMIFLTVIAGKSSIKFLAENLHLSESIIAIVYCAIPLLFVCLSIFFGYLFLTLVDLKRLVK